MERYRRSLYTVIFISVSELGRRLSDNNLTAASMYRNTSGLITDESYRRPGANFDPDRTSPCAIAVFPYITCARNIILNVLEFRRTLTVFNQQVIFRY